MCMSLSSSLSNVGVWSGCQGMRSIFIVTLKLLASIWHIKVGDVSRRMCFDAFVYLFVYLIKLNLFKNKGSGAHTV